MKLVGVKLVRDGTDDVPSDVTASPKHHVSAGAVRTHRVLHTFRCDRL